MNYDQLEPKAAVAVIELFNSNAEFPNSDILLIERSVSAIDPWSGHLAFPGGKIEKTDANPLETCIRETQEECGFTLNESDLFQKLPQAIAGKSNHREICVSPWHFKIFTRPPNIKINAEVADIHWVNTLDFTDLSRHKTFFAGPAGEQPCFWVNNKPLWGFTYGVLLRLFQLKTL